MSDLIVIGFPKVEEAEQVRRELVTIQQQHLIALEDACVLEHGEDGHVHLKQAINLAAAGAASGSFGGCSLVCCSSTRWWAWLWGLVPERHQVH